MYHIPVHEIELDRNWTKPKKEKLGGQKVLCIKWYAKYLYVGSSEFLAVVVKKVQCYKKLSRVLTIKSHAVPTCSA